MTTIRARRGPGILREGVLWLGAALGVLSIVLTSSALLLDVKPLVFRSGSMSPAIDAGALAVAREVPARSVEVGDVVSVIGADGVRVTHRVVSTGVTDDGATSLTLKGDANATPDAQAYVVRSVDRVLWDVPVAGRVVAFFGSPTGTFLIGVLVAGCLILAVRPGPGRPAGPTRPAGRRRAVDARVVVGIVGAAALVTPMLQPQATSAYFTDTATMSTGSVTSGALQPPTAVTCSGAGLLAMPTISWTAPTSGARPTGYRVIVRSGSATATPTTYETTSTSFNLPTNRLVVTTYFISVQSRRGDAWSSKLYASNGWQVSVVDLAFLGALSSCVSSYTPVQPAY